MKDVEAAAAALARAPVFRALTPERRAKLAAAGAPVQLRPGEFLFREGDPGDALFVLLIGELEVSLADAEGRTSVLARLGSGEVAGEMGAMSGGPRSADVAAVRRCQLWRIGRRAVLDALEAEGRAAMALVGLLADRLREADALVHRLQWSDLGARLAGALLDAAPGPLTESQGELARRIGASREAVNRRLAEWRNRGWIEADRAGLHLRRPDVLRRLRGGGPQGADADEV